MHRELRPDLFQNVEGVGSSPVQEGLRSSPPGLQEDWDVQNLKSELQRLRHEMEHSRRKVDLLEKKVDTAVTQSQEFMRTTGLRLERLTDALQRMREHHTQALQGLQADFAEVRGKVNERRLTETKVEELMDRQNMVIRNFESRMAALQKLVADKEMKLMNFSGLLEEARRELQRIRGY